MESKKETVIAYHGTDESYLPDILKNGFRANKNPTHWLGNGIYFYLDYELAKWWTTNPTSRFGSPIKNPVVIRASIHSTAKNTLDTRKLDDYRYLAELYEEFWAELTSGTVTKSINELKLRCMFFDWIHSNFVYDIFIAGFEKPQKPYGGDTLKYKFKIPYVEYQLCVFENELIIQKERVDDHDEKA